MDRIDTAAVVTGRRLFAFWQVPIRRTLSYAPSHQRRLRTDRAGACCWCVRSCTGLRGRRRIKQQRPVRRALLARRVRRQWWRRWRRWLSVAHRLHVVGPCNQKPAPLRLSKSAPKRSPPGWEDRPERSSVRPSVACIRRRAPARGADAPTPSAGHRSPARREVNPQQPNNPQPRP